MRIFRYLIIIMLTLSTGIVSAKSSKDSKGQEEVILEDTFAVSMDSEMGRKIKNAMKEQNGIKSVKLDMQEQQVVIQYQANANSTANLLQVFKKIGCVAVAMEQGCFGSKEGCLNARHPINWMP